MYQKSSLRMLPWPLAACLATVQSVRELQALVDQIEKGALGDIAEWRAAEQRWQSQGIIAEEIVQQVKGLQPFDSSIANWGDPPHWDDLDIASPNDANTLMQALFSIAEQLP